MLLLLNGCSPSSADFSVTLGGDILLARNGEAIFKDAGGAINPWSELEKDGVLIQDSNPAPDYFFANLESPLGNPSAAMSEMNLCAPVTETEIIAKRWNQPAEPGE